MEKKNSFNSCVNIEQLTRMKLRLKLDDIIVQDKQKKLNNRILYPLLILMTKMEGQF